MSYYLPRDPKQQPTRSIWQTAATALGVIVAGLVLGISAGAFITGCRIVSQLIKP